MFERDYLMKLLADLTQAIVRSLQESERDQDSATAADLLESAVCSAVNLDAGVFLSLAPESIASILSVSGTDPTATEYIARSLMLVSQYRKQAGDHALAELRAAQGRAIAAAYGHDVSDMEGDATAGMQEFLTTEAEALGTSDE